MGLAWSSGSVDCVGYSVLRRRCAQVFAADRIFT
jgi:hypothetical protein